MIPIRQRLLIDTPCCEHHGLIQAGDYCYQIGVNRFVCIKAMLEHGFEIRSSELRALHPHHCIVFPAHDVIEDGLILIDFSQSMIINGLKAELTKIYRDE